MTYQEAVENCSQRASVAESRPSHISQTMESQLTEERVESEPFDSTPKKAGLEEQALVQQRVKEVKQKYKKPKDKKLSKEKKSEKRKSLKLPKAKNELAFKYNIKLYKVKKDKGMMDYVSDLFSSNKPLLKRSDFAKVQHVPQIKGIPENEYETTVQAGQTAYIQFKVFNRTDRDWDYGCLLINDYAGGLRKNFYEIRKTVK